jgi:Rrf2 family protein
MNGRFQIAMHILTLLSRANNELLSSEYIAGSININPALVRKEISNLRKKGLINSKEGKAGGYVLGMPAHEIKLFTVYQAVKQQQLLGQAKNIPNPYCPVGKQINKHILHLDNEMENALSIKLSAISLAEFSRQFD